MSRQLVWAGTVGLAVASGCAGGATDAPDIGSAVQAEKQKDCAEDLLACGETSFNEDLKKTNGRACATCHIEADHFALTPAYVQNLATTDRKNPLFDAIDADDPTAKKKDLTFAHLKKGLVRVKLPLPPNVELLAVPPDATAFSIEALQGWVASGAANQIVTPADRMVEVWRAVPSIENTAYTAPFLYDGRATTLQDQAFGALQGHSQFTGARSTIETQLDAIAAFEKTFFSNARTVYVNDQLAAGVPLANIQDPEVAFPPTDGMDADTLASWQRGKQLYDQTCTGCHGAATDDVITDKALHNAFMVQLKSSSAADALEPGNIGDVLFVDTHIPRFADPPANTIPIGTLWVPKALPQSVTDESKVVNIATSFLTYLGQIAPQGITSFTKDVSFPKYRMRFYTNEAKTEWVDLPPLPELAQNFDPQNPGAVFAPKPIPGRLGAIFAGPNFAPQVFSTDPGRALITGNYWDFEAFDVPQLRGIKNTAPYFHDNQAATLSDVVTFYSTAVFPFIAPFIGMGDRTPNGPAPGIDILTPKEKADLVTFLNVF